jgi:hypothetical protein
MTSQDIYVMRVWHEGEKEAWRVTITDTKNQEKKHFATLETLTKFLRERLEDSVDPLPPAD